MDAQRLFRLPYRKVDTVANHEDENFITKKPVFCDHSTLHEVCEDLHSVKLPETACMEAVMADPNFLLLCLHLPQWLATHLRPYITTKSFIGHCKQHLPRLGMCLSKFPLEKVTEALTAKSCSEECSYEKLEWFGDAVLKLVQTDSLLQSKLSPNLHEGELSTLRSGKFFFASR